MRCLRVSISSMCILLSLLSSITNFNNTIHSHCLMLTDIINQQSILHPSNSHQRPLSAVHHPELSFMINQKKTVTPHHKPLKNQSASKQNTPQKPQLTNKEIHFPEWNQMPESKVNRKKSVVVIEMENLERLMEEEEQYMNENEKMKDFKDLDSVLANPEKVILPIKEYSNKFFRQKKAKAVLQANYTVFKPKKSLIYIRKQIRKNRQNQRAASKPKQNSIRSLKTQHSYYQSAPKNKQLHQYQNESKLIAQASLANCQNLQHYQSAYTQGACSTEKSADFRVSTSRALEMFSKVYKNERIERMRIRRQMINKTTEVQVKQMILQDMGKKQMKRSESQQKTLSRSRPTSKSCLHRKQRKREQHFEKRGNPAFSVDDENFQLAGW